MSLLKPAFVLGLALTGACVVQPDDEPGDELGESAQDITGAASAPASKFQRDRALKIVGCTATRISARWAITAMHCNPQPGDDVNFYNPNGTGFEPSLGAKIDMVKLRPGASPTACGGDFPWNCDDNTGLFADVALIRLANISPVIDGTANTNTPATLAWDYPGDGVTGTQVGAGGHNGNPNKTGILRQIAGVTDDDEDDSGDFWTVENLTDKGDSGGPFYDQDRILGTLWGTRWDPVAAHYDLYTSVPKHLDWILQTIGYDWVGTPSQPNTKYEGTTVDAFDGATDRTCQYACQHTQSCEAYNIHASTCVMLTGVTGVSTVSGYRGAVHYGGGTGQSNEVVGYRRTDGWNSVLHKGATDGLIHELAIGSSNQWLAFTISTVMQGQTTPNPVLGKLSPVRRSDGKDAFVYRSTNGAVMEIANDGGWKPRRININLPAASGDPVAFVRSDGVTSVVYRAATRIIELRLLSDGTYTGADLSQVTNSTGFPAESDPSPTVRADGFTSVVYRSGTTIVELFRFPGELWSFGVPGNLVTWYAGGFPQSLPQAAGRPYASTRRDGTLAIVTRTAPNNRLLEMRLQSDGWKWQDVTGLATPHTSGTPVQYVRTDAVDSIVYRDANGAVNEVSRLPTDLPATTHAYNLSASYSVSGPAGDPQVFVRNDRVNSTVYGLVNNRVGELGYERGVGWYSNNLSFSAGEQP